MKYIPVILCCLLAAMPFPARATATLSRQFALSCTACHTAVPLLNSFGRYFHSNGDRVAGRTARATIPLSATTLTVYDASAEHKFSTQEIRLQSAQAFGTSFDYFVSTYLVDGGAPGNLAQAYVDYRSGILHPEQRQQVDARAGYVYLPLPVYAETYRETLAGYAAFEQAPVDDAFTLAGSHTAFQLSAGHEYDGFEATGLLLFGQQRGAMYLLSNRAERIDSFLYGAYGTESAGPFSRNGAAVTLHGPRLQWTTLFQSGTDRAGGLAVHSSAGFSQLVFTLSKQSAVTLRLDGTSDRSGSQRTFITSFSQRATPNGRLILEDAFSAGHHTAQAALILGF